MKEIQSISFMSKVDYNRCIVYVTLVEAYGKAPLGLEDNPFSLFSSPGLSSFSYLSFNSFL